MHILKTCLGIFAFALMITLPCGVSHADGQVGSVGLVGRNGQDGQTVGKRERFDQSVWFFYLSTGLGWPTYDDDISQRMTAQRAAGGSSNAYGTFDAPGVYRVVQPGLAAGLVLNASFEQVARDWREHNSFAVHAYNPAASVFWFPGERMGLGWFLRGDLGYSRILQVREYRIAGQDRFDRINSDAIFTQAAAGYGFSAGSVSRLLVHVNATRSSGSHHSITGMNLNVGFLF